MKSKMQIFEKTNVRSVWDEEQEKWWFSIFSIIDVIAVLTESDNPSVYWRVLKKRLKAEGNETVTNCNALKLVSADGKMRLTDVADTEQLLRLIQSIPSKKAEPFKLWLAQVGSERIDETLDPELSIDRAVENLRDNMTNLELIINMLSEATTTELSAKSQPKNLQESAEVAREGANVAKTTRNEIEKRGGTVISSVNAKLLGKREGQKKIVNSNILKINKKPLESKEKSPDPINKAW